MRRFLEGTTLAHRFSRRTLIKGAIAYSGLRNSNRSAHSVSGNLSAVPVRNFGVRGDGVHDDTAALREALAAGRPIFFDRLMTCIVNQIDVPSGAVIIGNGAALLLRPGEPAFTSILSLMAVTNVAVSDIVLDGNRHHQRTDVAEQDGGMHGIRIIGCKNVCIRNVTIYSCFTDGLYLSDDSSRPGGKLGRQTEKVFLQRVRCTGNRRQGMSIISASQIDVVDSTFEGTSGSLPAAGVDVEPNSVAQAVTDVRFVRCTFRDNAGHGFVANIKGGLLRNVLLEDCVFTGSRKSLTLDYEPGSRIEGFCVRRSRGDGRFLFGGQTSEGVRVSHLLVDTLSILGEGFLRIQSLGAGSGERIRVQRLNVRAVVSRPVLEIRGTSAGIHVEEAILSNIGSGPVILIESAENVQIKRSSISYGNEGQACGRRLGILVISSYRVHLDVRAAGCGNSQSSRAVIRQVMSRDVIIER